MKNIVALLLFLGKQTFQKIYFILFAVIIIFGLNNLLLSPIQNSLTSLTTGKKGYEVFGFAPYWTLNNLQNVDFNVLTTLAYFGIPINEDGSLDTTSQGYISFTSSNATALFQKAHSYCTRVVLTLTQMDNPTILSFLDNPAAQQQTINQSVSTIKQRGIDGINVDFEYLGDPGQSYKDKFSSFIRNLTLHAHKEIPASQVTVSVYASSIIDPKIYDIKSLSYNSDGIFMMAYDFATTTSTNAMPTSPLYGYKQGVYWYDISTAVNDFMTQMPANKLILGVPWYGYDYAVYNPSVNAQTVPTYYWNSESFTQTYATASENITPTTDGYQTGWDNVGEVGYKAYYIASSGTWRIVFMEDQKSLGLKYDFAKNKQLKGIGIWALGFDSGTSNMWQELENKFGTKISDSSVLQKIIQTIN